MFKVHRSLLSRASRFFASMFSLQQPSNDEEEGTEKRPLVIPQISPEVLASLLNVIYQP